MIPLGDKLVASLGHAVFHAAVHIAGHETFHHIKHKFVKTSLQNHDISRALNEAYIAALTILERDYMKSLDSKTETKVAQQAFKALRNRAKEFFPARTGPYSIPDDQAAKMVKDPSVADGFLEELLTSTEPMTDGIRDLMRANFRDSFSYAFKEVGLKANDKVRAVIQHELMEDLRSSQAVSGEKLDLIEGELQQLPTLLEGQTQIAEFQKRFHDSIAQGLDVVGEKVDAVKTDTNKLIEGQKELTKLIEKSQKGDGPVLAYVKIYDGEGNELERHTLREKVVSIGREKDNAIQLHHAKVSGSHAELKIEDGFILLKDLGSTNGTWIGKEKVKKKMVLFGQKIQIKPFELELESPDADKNPYMAPGTIPVE